MRRTKGGKKEWGRGKSLWICFGVLEGGREALIRLGLEDESTWPLIRAAKNFTEEGGFVGGGKRGVRRRITTPCFRLRKMNIPSQLALEKRLSGPRYRDRTRLPW